MTRTYGFLALVAALGMAIDTGVAAPEVEESSPQDIFQQLDKNSDGILTADEVPESKARFFDHLIRIGDQNKDGKLTKDEFSGGLNKEDQQFPTGEASRGNRDRRRGNFDLNAFLTRLDRNGDKKISKSELPPPMRERMEPMFERLNSDEISIEEFVKISNRFRGGRPSEAQNKKPAESSKREQRFFGMLDKNQDGKLTLDEVPERSQRMVRRMLKQTGKGEDESVTKEEFVKGLAQFRPDRRRPGRETESDKKEEMQRPEMRTQMESPRSDRPFRGPRSPFFLELDQNQDGKLTKDELNKINSVFDRLDRNENGFLEMEEIVGQRPRERRTPTRLGDDSLKGKSNE